MGKVYELLLSYHDMLFNILVLSHVLYSQAGSTWLESTTKARARTNEFDEKLIMSKSKPWDSPSLETAPRWIWNVKEELWSGCPSVPRDLWWCHVSLGLCTHWSGSHWKSAETFQKRRLVRISLDDGKTPVPLSWICGITGTFDHHWKTRAPNKKDTYA